MVVDRSSHLKLWFWLMHSTVNTIFNHAADKTPVKLWWFQTSVGKYLLDTDKMKLKMNIPLGALYWLQGTKHCQIQAG